MLERVWRKGNLLHCWWECKLVQPLWRTVWRFLKKLEIELPYDPAIPLPGIHIEETRIERDTCTPTRTWKQPRCPSADECIRKLWYIYTMEYSDQIRSGHSVVSDSLRPHEMQHARPPCPSPAPGVETHVHQVSDAIQPSHPLSSPSPLAPNPSQHQSLFQLVNSSHEVAKVLEFQL